MKIKLYKNGKLPEYKNIGDSAMDCYSAENVDWKLERGSFVTKVKLGFGCLVPKGYGLFLLSRSGMGFNHHITLINSVGLIDNSYGLNEVQCKLTAPTEITPTPIKVGDRICQMCIIQTPEIFWDVIKGNVPSKYLGKDGFGSSGI